MPVAGSYQGPTCIDLVLYQSDCVTWPRLSSAQVAVSIFVIHVNRGQYAV